MLEKDINYEGINVHVRWFPGAPMPKENITRAWGYVFNNQGEVLIVESRGTHWTTIGGHPEGNETPVETFKREVFEEACVEIEKPKYLGYYECVEQNDPKPFYQLHFAALLKKDHPFIPLHETTKRAFVKVTEIGNYIPWTKNDPIFEDGMRLALEYFRGESKF